MNGEIILIIFCYEFTVSFRRRNKIFWGCLSHTRGCSFLRCFFRHNYDSSKWNFACAVIDSKPTFRLQFGFHEHSLVDPTTIWPCSVATVLIAHQRVLQEISTTIIWSQWLSRMTSPLNVHWFARWTVVAVKERTINVYWRNAMMWSPLYFPWIKNFI